MQSGRVGVFVDGGNEMKKLLIIIIVLLILTSFVYAKLSDETLKIVNDLKWKHFGWIVLDDDVVLYDSDFVYEWWSFYFEDGKLFIETQDGKWFIEMEKVIK